MTMQIPLIDISRGDAETSDSSDLYVTQGKIYVRRIRGFFQRIRSVTLSILFGMYFSFAWIKIGTEPLILFDIGAQKFHLFGAVFWPQDFTLLALALIISAFGLFFISSLFGRIWCGYSCPQTAWSLIFIWLEELFEGSRNQRIRLDNSGATASKWLKKGSKHLSWLVIALATAITFVGYFTPIRELCADLFTLNLESGWAWFWIAFITAATYFNAGWLREKVCIYMCPYARFQSVMFNENTMIVGYDKKRGDPRGSRSRNSSQETLGDCIDCKMCVQVCPVGIDIRDGLQYECIGCALCIDACDSIMDKMNYQKGLIRYASEKEFEQGKNIRKMDSRALGYGLLMISAIGLFTVSMLNRPVVEISAIKDRGPLYQETGLGKIQNFYTLRLVNKRETADIFLLSLKGEFPMQASGGELAIGPGEVKTFPISIEAEPEDIQSSSSSLQLHVQSLADPSVNAVTQSKFLGPAFRP